jgi:hypothetical protein
MKASLQLRFLFLAALTAAFIVPLGSRAQQNQGGQGAVKTVTIHVTTEENGNTTVIDTTVITSGDFDEDAFLRKKLADTSQRVIVKTITMKQPGCKESFMEGREKGDTLMVEGDTVIIIHVDNEFDRPASPPGDGEMAPGFCFNAPRYFPDMHCPKYEHHMERMMRSYGFNDLRQFGDIKEIVVKKKRHGKKVIITFEDRDEEKGQERREGHGRGNEGHRGHDEGSFRHPEGGTCPGAMGCCGENCPMKKAGEGNVIIRQDTNTERNVIIRKEIKEGEPVNEEKKVIIIKEVK